MKYISPTKIALAVIACALTTISWVQPALAAEDKAPNVYLHLGGQIGLDWLSSSDIESVVGDFSVGSLGFPIGLLGRAGFRNIVQAEVQKLNAHHDLRQVGFTGDDGFFNTGLGTVAEIKMKYKETARLIKLNPAYWNYSQRKASTVFFIFGTGDITYRDEAGDGWEGTSKIYGLEWTRIQRYTSVSAGLRYSDINFDSNTLSDLRNRDFAADQYYFYFSFALGLGF